LLVVIANSTLSIIKKFKNGFELKCEMKGLYVLMICMVLIGVPGDLSAVLCGCC